MLSFLGELGLLQHLAPALEFMDFSGANLKRLSLGGMDFEGSNLRRAELERADLRGADFESTDLRGANLNETRVDGANFDHADLRGADLSNATGATPDQLKLACLDATTILPKAMTLAHTSASGCTGTAQDD